MSFGYPVNAPKEGKTRLLVEVLHEDGQTKFIREARLSDIQNSALLYECELRLVPYEFVLAAERHGEQAKECLAPERVVKALKDATNLPGGP